MQQLNQYLTEVQLVNSRSGNPVSALDFWKNNKKKIDLCDKLTHLLHLTLLQLLHHKLMSRDYLPRNAL